MDAGAITRAAKTVWSLWQRGEALPELAPDIRPATRAEGYAIQARLDDLAQRSCAGWKIAATSTAGQQHIGVSGPLAGRIFAARVLASGSTASLAGNRMRVAEPEFAFRFARTLAPRAARYEAAEVLAAVESLHLSIELPNSRFSNFAKVGEPTLVADDACAHMLVLGDVVTADWRGLDLSRHEVHARVDDRYRREGIGANVLGDPRIALTWLVNELSSLRTPLHSGQFVTTGTCMVPLEIEPGDAVEADFGVLGQIGVRLA